MKNSLAWSFLLMAAWLLPTLAYSGTGCDTPVHKRAVVYGHATPKVVKHPQATSSLSIVQVDGSIQPQPISRQMGSDDFAHSIWAILLAGIGAAVVAGWIAHRSKVAEFRQKWIDDLRKDIADYVGVSERWFYKWCEHNSGYGTGVIARELQKISNEALVIQQRIKLRINPYNNLYKQGDDEFLESLGKLVDPSKLDPDQLQASWRDLADEAVKQGGEILKREWQVTKSFFFWPWITIRRKVG